MKKLLYIHIPKTAGRYVKKNIIGPNVKSFYVYGSRKYIDRLHSRDGLEMHIQYEDISVNDNVVPFATVRNPYDWLESFYFHKTLQEKNEEYLKFSTFEDFVLSKNEDLLDNQTRYVKGVPAENLLKMENLYVNLREFFVASGFNIKVPEVVNDKFVNNNKVKVEWTTQMVSIINDYYKDDFEKLGYDYV